MKHNHVLSSGWSRGRQVFRECVECRQIFRWYGSNKKPDKISSDYDFYRKLAEYYGVR